MNTLGNLYDTSHNPQTSTVNATIITESGSDGIKISLAENPQGGTGFFHIEENYDDRKGYVSAFVSRQQIEDAVNAIVIILPFTAIICMLISTVFALCYSQTLTRPIAQISRTTEQMKNLQPDTLCSCNTDDEIGILATNINSLYQTLLQTISDLEQEVHKVEQAEMQKIDFYGQRRMNLKHPLPQSMLCLKI